MRVLRIAAAIVILQFPTVAIAQVATGDSFVPLDQLQLRNPLNADLVKKRVGETPATYLLALGALEKINHVIEPEDSRLITGTKSTWTFELPDARSTGSIGDFYRAQLTSIGAILFECSGRGCGSSSYWAMPPYSMVPNSFNATMLPNSAPGSWSCMLPRELHGISMCISNICIADASPHGMLAAGNIESRDQDLTIDFRLTCTGIGVICAA